MWRCSSSRAARADRRLLDDLARQAASAAHALRLSTDLQHSRERLVAAREEERRRIPRDLHDGLRPQLASQTLTIDAIRALLVRDSAGADELLGAWKAPSQGAVSEIRRLVYGFRPPTLDDLGRVQALREETLTCVRAGLAVHIEIGDPLERLSAAAEVAVFRISQEALTNMVRHANASSVTVRLRRSDEQVCLEVIDEGCGVAADRRAGVGLTSMRERAEELGAECEDQGTDNPRRGPTLSARPETAEEHHWVGGECLSMQRKRETRILLPLPCLVCHHLIAMAFGPRTRLSGTASPPCGAGYAVRLAS